ncbi:BlaI/MecI/CopY family transcriptional regulator [Caulobacter sp. RHG1]|uniref:BlaI/MecI/CopY family transcriptional regulator n=1 Tax=Caulobacter sp. (strain RHG1) TaxID=2545762 RepID=UPI00155621B5|nr:BlaI/MecI/CopY family transcriptional regulator [Caulobacter sp. RHG1]NQE61758.1 Transcriptional repressor, BlaI/MecI family [Caulobacter sp. RHG1]
MHITSAEAQVMEALWRRHPLSADELVAEVGAAQSWGDATVKTLINRLLKKKAIKSERAEGKHGYRPLVEREAYVQTESQGLLDRLFDGQLAPLISHFAQHRPLKADEVEKLKTLIAGLEEKR